MTQKDQSAQPVNQKVNFLTMFVGLKENETVSENHTLGLGL